MPQENLLSQYHHKVMETLTHDFSTQFSITSQSHNIYTINYLIENSSIASYSLKNYINITFAGQEPNISLCFSTLLIDTLSPCMILADDDDRQDFLEAILAFKQQLFIGELVNIEGQIHLLMVIDQSDLDENPDYFLHQEGFYDLISAYHEQLDEVMQFIKVFNTYGITYLNSPKPCNFACKVCNACHLRNEGTCCHFSHTTSKSPSHDTTLLHCLN